MHLVRYQTEDGDVRVGIRQDSALRRLTAVADMAALLRLRATELRAAVESALSEEPTEDVRAVRMLPPLDGRAEVWCAGVTYERSKGARMEETTEQSVYDRVYTAARPELFPKSPAWRLVTDAEPIGIRADSGHDVPEPELAVVVNAHGEIVGYTICDDVSSRSIEGENPLYIPQAKVFAGGCALAPGIRPAWEVPDPQDLTISLRVRRGATIAFEGTTSTGKLARSLPDLVAGLCAPNDFPDGVVLATGTGIVPELDFTLRAEDVVEIEIEEVGRLTNPVMVGKEAFAWLAADPTARPQLEEAR